MPERRYYPTHKIPFYAQRVLTDLGLNEPPILVEPVLEYFGIKLHWIDLQAESEFKQIRGVSIEAPAFLYVEKDEPHIFVREADKEERRRLSIFHEVGHFDIPWHRGFDYFCNCGDDDASAESIREKEAFDYASNLIFPAEIFYEDINSLEPSMPNILLLAEKYRASFEATAIRYIALNPRACAVLYLTLNPYADATGNPFLVRYSVKSKSFPQFWPPKTEIRGFHPFVKCITYRFDIKTEIPARELGSGKSLSYIGEMGPHGINQICVLLFLPDKQLNAF